MQDVSVTSETRAYSGREILLAVIPYARYSYSLPHHYGVAILCEAPAEQVGVFEDAVVTSGFGPYSSVREAWDAFSGPHKTSYRKPLPSPASGEELLDWDLAIQVPPPRVSGTISVTLKYAGRSVPTPFLDPTDE